jgi:hypothetical protein
MYDFNPGSIVAYAAINSALPASFRFNNGFVSIAEPALGIYTLTLPEGRRPPSDEVAILCSIMNAGGSLSFANSDYDPATGIVTVFTRTAGGSTERDFAVLVLRDVAQNP